MERLSIQENGKSFLPIIFRFQGAHIFGILSFIIPILVAVHKFGFKIGTFSTPLFFYGDEFFGAAWINSLIKSKSLTNDTFGYPAGQNLNYAFVAQDSVPHIFAALIGSIKSNPYFGLNVYLILSFGLVGLSFFIAARMLGSSNWIAMALGIAVSLLPQHFSSSTQAITVVSFFAIPILLAKTTLQLTERNLNSGSLISKSNIKWFAFSFASGMLYSYYSIGTILIFGTVAIVLCILDGSFKAIKSISITIFGTICGFFLVSLPSLLYVGKTLGGVNYYLERSWQAAYVTSGSFIQSITPSYGTITYKSLNFLHSSWVATFEQLKNQINSYGIFQEGWAASIPLGLILLYFSITAFYGNYSRKTEIKNYAQKSQQQIFILGGFGIISLLWMWAGGLGTFFAMFVSETLRGYARFSVYAVSSLALAAAIGLSTLQKSKIREFLFFKCISGIALLLFVGDGFTIATYSQPKTIQTNVKEIQQMVSLIPQNCNVLQFPVIHFPYESPGWPGYALMAPGLVSPRTDIKWSSGLVGGSPAWVHLKKYRDFQNKPSSELIDLARQDGFCSILVDTNVWETFYNFMPVPTYNRVPGSTVDKFLLELNPTKVYKTSLTTYHLYVIKP
jgi:hypothetical protein